MDRPDLGLSALVVPLDCFRVVTGFESLLRVA
jgi:hypothetical protein